VTPKKPLTLFFYPSPPRGEGRLRGRRSRIKKNGMWLTQRGKLCKDFFEGYSQID